MNNFFLLNEAVSSCDLPAFIKGMSELNAIERETDDSFLRHESFWELPVLKDLYAGYGQEEQFLIIFLAQLSPSSTYISSHEIFDHTYPNELNAFLGIDFAGIVSVENEKRITNHCSFIETKRKYYSNLYCIGNKDRILFCLKQLYKKYHFTDQAIDDITYWNSTDINLYKKLHDLLEDIMFNTFTGGLGKTEVLKNQNGNISKRLNDEHRLVYNHRDNKITILSCRGHYT